MNQINTTAMSSVSAGSCFRCVLPVVATVLVVSAGASDAHARTKGHQAISNTKGFTIGSGGHDEIDDFADPNQCEVVDLNGAADGLFDHGDTVDIVKSFDVGNVLPAQLVTTIGATTEGTFSLDPFAAVEETPIVLLIVPHDSGVDAFRVHSGSITITGAPNTGDAELFFDSLIMGQVENGTNVFIENGPCYSFWDFTLDGVVNIPGSWTCADELYTDATCHCGCGAVDPSCGRLERCDVCGANGSCAEGKRGCATIDPENSGACVEPPKKPELLTYDDDIAPIIALECAFCHLGAGNQPVLSYAFMMSEVSTDETLWDQYPEYANYDFNVVPSHAEESLVWKVHLETGNMPTTGPLSDEDLATFLTWINQGAVEN